MPPRNPPSHVSVHLGPKVRILAVRLPDGSCPAHDFLTHELSDVEQATMAVRFTVIGETGFIRNDQHFKQLEGSKRVLEFKDHQVRLFACWAGKGRMFLLFGVRKKKDKHRRSDIDKAERLAAFAEALP